MPTYSVAHNSTRNNAAVYALFAERIRWIVSTLVVAMHARRWQEATAGRPDLALSGSCVYAFRATLKKNDGAKQGIDDDNDNNDDDDMEKKEESSGKEARHKRM